jgi:hypothetical protein
MRLVFASLALLVVSGTAFARPAQKQSHTQSIENAARKACLTGDFRKGVDLLADLFIETRDINCIYNQARCFEQNHQWQEASDRFREFLRKSPNLSTAVKAETETHIAECEAQQARLAPPPPAPPPPVPAPVPAPVAPVPPPAPAAGSVKLSAPAAAEDHSLRTAGIVTAAVGLAALGAGLAFNLEANSLSKELNQNWERDKASRRDTYQTLTWVGYGVGAAALVTGATLIIVGWNSGKSGPAAPAVSLTPVVLPGFTALTLRGNY